MCESHILLCQPLTSVQLIELHPILQGKEDACEEIFLTVAYNFNQYSERKRKSISPKQSKFDASKKISNSQIMNEVPQDLFLPRNISSCQGNINAGHHTRMIPWHRLLVFLVIIYCLYGFYKYGWSFRWYRKESGLQRMQRLTWMCMKQFWGYLIS